MTGLCRALVPYEPLTVPLSVAQRAFLSFHARRGVDRWQWHFLNSQLRAHAGKHRVTIWRRELDELIGRGLMRQGIGCADVHATNKGKAAL